MSSPKRSFAQKYFGPEATFVFFAGAGTLHLLRPGMYEQIMPPQIPAHHELVILSGYAEILGGVLYAIPKTRRLGAWYLIALLIAVFPSNIYMASQEKFQQQVPGGKAALLARLPLQFVMIWWLDRLAKRTAPAAS
ncbi:MAG: hypothetical protein AAGC46_10010 [Solirubrobacteraceae bacterium]|nr:hypothetical protein [Patulibacter sp.]